MNEIKKNTEGNECIYDPEKYFIELSSIFKNTVEQEKYRIDAEIQKHIRILKEFVEKLKQIDLILDEIKENQSNIGKNYDANPENKDFQTILENRIKAEKELLKINQLLDDQAILLSEIEKIQSQINLFKKSAIIIDTYFNLPAKYQNEANRFKIILAILKIALTILNLIIAFISGFLISEKLSGFINNFEPEYSKYIAFLVIFLFEEFLFERLVSRLKSKIWWKFVSKIKNLFKDFDVEILKIKDDAKASG